MWFRRRSAKQVTPTPEPTHSSTQTVLHARPGGFTSRGEADIDGIIDEMIVIEDHATRTIATEGGQLLNAFNGTFVAAFASGPSAFRAAMAIVANSGRIPMQCGLHAGQIYVRDGRRFSSAFGTASSVCAQAHGRQIVVSESVAGLLKPHLSAAHALKPLPQTLRGHERQLFAVVDARELASEQKHAFISYRRDGGSELARLVSSGLGALGVETFLDVDHLGASHFDDQLLRKIEDMKNFIPILSPGALDNCHDPNDWMGREIRHAIATKRNIVPVLLPRFQMPGPDALPESIAEVLRHHGVSYSHEFANEAVAKLASLLKAGSDSRL
jgi:hypothetical protein